MDFRQLYPADTADERYSLGRPGEGSFAQMLADWTRNTQPPITGSTMDGFMPPGMETPPAAGREDRRFSALFGAAFEANRLVDQHAGPLRALEQAADNRIDTVRRLTNMEIENPFRQGYYMDARRRVEERRARGEPIELSTQTVVAEARTIFNEQMNLAAERFPQHAAAFNFFVPMEEQARDIARAASDGAANARAAMADRPYGALFAEIGGGLAGALTDPVQIVGMALGAGPGTARTLAGRIGQVALREGAINAGLAAVEEPTIQLWRKELGLPSGPAEAAQNIALAGVLGAAFGGGVQGLREVFKKGDAAALAKVLNGTASSAEVERALKAAGLELSEQDRAAIRLAGEAEADAAALMPKKPRDVDPEAHAEAIDQALRNAIDPDNAPPATAPLVPPRARLDDADRALLDQSLPAMERGELSPVSIARLLRDRPALAPEIVPRLGPDGQNAMGLAALSDEVFAAFTRGEIDLAGAAWIGRILPDRPELHASALRDVLEMKPQGETQLQNVIRESARPDRNLASYMIREDAAGVLWRAAELADEMKRLRDAIDDVPALKREAAAMAALRGVEEQLASLQRTLAGAKGKAREKLLDRIADLATERETLAARAPGGAPDAKARQADLRRQLAEADQAMRDMAPEISGIRSRAEAARASDIAGAMDRPIEPGSREAAEIVEALTPEPAKPKAEAPDAPAKPPGRPIDPVEIEARPIAEKLVAVDDAGARFDFVADLTAQCRG